MRNVPIEVLLNWPTPNYDNPVNRNSQVIIFTSIILPLCVITVLARLYSKIFVLRTFGADDWMIIPAAITGVGYCICAIEGIWHGWYRHIWDNTVLQVVEARKLVVAMSFFAILNAGFIKLSVLLLYRRLFLSSSYLRTIIDVLIILTLGWMISMSVTNFLLCIPLQAYWQVFYSGEQTCLEELPYFVSFSITDLVLDLAIYVLPLPRAMALNLAHREKWVVVGLFGFGILTMAAAAARLPLLLRASQTYDVTWELFGAAMWTEVEIFVGIFCASAPALKPLIVRYAPALLDRVAPTTHSLNLESRRDDTVVEIATTINATRDRAKSNGTASVNLNERGSEIKSSERARRFTSDSENQYFEFDVDADKFEMENLASKLT